MRKGLNQLSDFFSPELLKHKLIVASVFIAAYENLKAHIVDDVKYFYWNGNKNGKDEFKDYEEKVLSKATSQKKRQIKATLLWYKEHGAISDEDITTFEDMTDLRNTLSHNLLGSLLDGLPDNILDTYFQMIGLFEKIIKWWIIEIEIPTNPDFTSEQYDSINWDEVTSVDLEFIKMMTDIALTGNENYLEILKATKDSSQE